MLIHYSTVNKCSHTIQTATIHTVYGAQYVVGTVDSLHDITSRCASKHKRYEKLVLDM